MIPAALKPTVTRAALDAIDIRVGTIVRVEDIPKAAKLVRLIVDFGDHQRTIIAGLKQERPDVHALENPQGLFVVNIEPRMIMGEESPGDALRHRLRGRRRAMSGRARTAGPQRRAGRLGRTGRDADLRFVQPGIPAGGALSRLRQLLVAKREAARAAPLRAQSRRDGRRRGPTGSRGADRPRRRRAQA